MLGFRHKIREEASMSGKLLESLMARRSLLARLGVGIGLAGAFGANSPKVLADTGSDTSFRPARHAQDDWLDKIPGQHRFVFDTTTPDGLALALRFARNYYR